VLIGAASVMQHEQAVWLARRRTLLILERCHQARYSTISATGARSGGSLS
jgi:hypothetical protein